MNPPTETPLLTDEELAALVDKGHALSAAIEANETRLKAINQQLTAHALSVPAQHTKLTDEDREGTRFIANGSDGKTVAIVCTADLISQSLPDDAEDKQLAAVKAAAGDQFSRFYKKVSSYVTTFSKSSKFEGKRFREAARASLPDPEAFISACTRRNKDGIPVSQIKVEW